MKTIQKRSEFDSICAITVMASVVFVSGCASAIPVWQKDWNPATNPAPAKPINLEQAKNYAEAARRAYQDAEESQVAQSTNVAAGLVGLGAVLAGLAVGKVHRDVILVGSLAGATAYAVSGIELPRGRIAAYQTGSKAITCALQAIVPLDMPDDDFKKFQDAAGLLKYRRDELRDQIAITSNEKVVGETQRALAEATLVVAEANTELSASAGFITQRRHLPQNLTYAVDRIDLEVRRNAVEATPDVTAVPKIIGGLASLAGSFVPGAGIDVVIKNAGNKAVAEARHTEAAKETPLQKLQEKTQALRQALLDVQRQRAGYGEALSNDVLVGCPVGDIVTPLKVTLPKLMAKPKVEKAFTVDIVGGVKPYFARLDAATDGLNVVSPLLGDSTVKISTGKTYAGGTHTVVIVDSSVPSRTANIVIADSDP